MKAKFLIGSMTIIVMILIMAGTAMADTQLAVEPTWTPPPPGDDPCPSCVTLICIDGNVYCVTATPPPPGEDYPGAYPYPLPTVEIYPYPGPGQDGLIMKSEQWWQLVDEDDVYIGDIQIVPYP